MKDPLIPFWDPLGRSMPAAYVEEFRPLGARLLLESNRVEIIEACRKSFGRYVVESEEISDAPRIAVRLLVDEEFKERPPWPCPVFRGHGGLFYISVGKENTAVADLSTRTAIGFITPAMAEDSDRLRGVFLDCLVLTMLTHGVETAYTYVHASAVARGDRGILFSGPSESGKSTMAYACARRGFDVVADDVVYLRRERNGLRAWGRPWHLRFLPDAPKFFPEIAQDGMSRGIDGKEGLEVEVERILPGRARQSCLPAAVLFLERGATGTLCEPISTEEALRRLSLDLISDVPEALAQHKELWLELLRRSAFLLRYDENLDSAVELVEHLLKSPARED